MHEPPLSNLVDVIAYNHARSDKPTAIDVTVSYPMLPTYIAAALKDAEAIINKRDKEKTDKHGPGCEAQHRDFMAAVYTTRSEAMEPNHSSTY